MASTNADGLSGPCRQTHPVIVVRHWVLLQLLVRRISQRMLIGFR